MACKQAIGFIFPVHWSELSTSLKATLRVSDLSFGSLVRTFCFAKCGLQASHRIYLSDSLVRTFNFVESHTSCVRFIFRFTKKRKTSPPNPFFFRNTKGVETVLFEHISTKCVTQHINKSTEEGVFIYKTFSVT